MAERGSNKRRSRSCVEKYRGLSSEFLPSEYKRFRENAFPVGESTSR